MFAVFLLVYLLGGVLLVGGLGFALLMIFASGMSDNPSMRAKGRDFVLPLAIAAAGLGIILLAANT